MSLRTITADSGWWVLLLRYDILFLLFLPYNFSQVLEPLNAFLLIQNTDTQIIHSGAELNWTIQPVNRVYKNLHKITPSQTYTQWTIRSGGHSNSLFTVLVVFETLST